MAKNRSSSFLKLHYILLLCMILIYPSDGREPDGVVITESDYQGLQALKHSLVDPNGFLNSWNDTGLGACFGFWAGIKCVRGQVIAIHLPWRGLGGRITEKIGQLLSLRKLSLHDNFIGGQIPSSIGFLRSLRGVHLFNNRFSGTIPPSIGNCLYLQSLDLSNNSLVGTIPDLILNSKRIYRLNLSYNNLSGTIPVGLTPSPSLTFLSLQHNSLSGPIPEGIGSLPKIRILDFSSNSISGGLPTSITELTSLIELRLDNNLIDTQISSSIDGLKNLSVLSLKKNRFNGEIPQTLGNITSLSQLDLSDNDFRGEIPSSLANLSNLTTFNVSNNNLSGPVPQPLVHKFDSSSFRGNLQLCGYNPSVPCPSSPPSLSPTTKSGRRKLNTRDIILITVGVVLAILLLLCCVFLCCLVKRRAILSKKSKEQGGEKPGPATGPEVESAGDVGGKLVHFDGPFVFTADDLLCATAEIMGKSTYGTAYRATLEDGNEVAVKRLREKIAKGQREFEAEVNVLGKIRHENLLALRAYYLGPKGEKLLVFDYMPKGSLSAFLHARGPNTPIDWPTRIRIIVGTARGLDHLHNQMKMIHGNLTSSNILLDEHTNPRISDYGISRLMTPAATSNVIATASTLGYRAPELSKLKKASTKTDVYSLGVVILELLTGKSPGEKTSGADLPQWVASIVKEEWTNEVFDLDLMKDAEGSVGDELLNTLKLALHCVDPSPSARPEVRGVMQQLEEIKPELAATASSGEEGEAGDG